MPRNPIDYSKCVIYKLCCKDPTITDIYVGHTTDKRTRKSNHRSRCNDENDKYYNFYVYQFIRDHGNFDNWEMIILEEYPCENINQARLRERYWLETLQATLNKNIPSRTIQQYREQNKEYFNEYNKQYREQNKEYFQQYREQNREYFNEYQKQYYEENKEYICEKAREKIECECGGKYSRSHKLRHFKSKKHLKYLESK